MKRLIYFLVILSISLFACNISTGTPPVVTSPPGVTEPPVAPVVTEPPIITNNVTCNELAFHLDPALASSYNCQTIPESAEGIAQYPAYTELTLQGYALTDKFFPPTISVFSIPHYEELLPGFTSGAVPPLQALISGATPADSVPFGPSLPFLLTFEAGQVFHAQYQVLPFASGSGIRYLTQFAQNYALIDNHDMIYTYQGLSSDGQYWVTVILPITNPILPENGDAYPGGETWQQFTDNYDTYHADITAQLNSQASASFNPTLGALDALVASITIHP